MPFKSQAQRAWMSANDHDPKMAREWQRDTPKGKLPKRTKKANGLRARSK